MLKGTKIEPAAPSILASIVKQCTNSLDFSSAIFDCNLAIPSKCARYGIPVPLPDLPRMNQHSVVEGLLKSW
jgi:hypothetical protein